MTQSSTDNYDALPMPEVAPFLAKCGKGTAYYGALIQEQLRVYGRAAISAYVAASSTVESVGMGPIEPIDATHCQREVLAHAIKAAMACQSSGGAQDFDGILQGCVESNVSREARQGASGILSSPNS